MALALLLMLGVSCNDFLELEPLDKVGPERLLESEKGIKTLLADLYSMIPMEDFAWRPGTGFNRRGWGSGIGEMNMTPMFTDEAIRTDGGSGLGPGSYGGYFGDQYNRNRDITLFLNSIEEVKNRGVISEATYNHLFSEAHFVRAYLYFGLAKRWGGVPIIERLLDDDFIPGTISEALFIPRSSERETWRFVLKECDLAIANLPTEAPADGIYRATKWAAYALKSRVALHAASVAKYWNNAPLIGDAVTQGLVGGFSASDIEFFYNECLAASKEIIDNSGKSLYMPNPADPAEATKNYQDLFMAENKPSISEYIFGRAYLDGSQVQNQGHDYDIRYSPSQGHPGFHKFGRFSVALDIVDAYEDYSNDGAGQSVPIATRIDGVENRYLDPERFDVTIPFIHYDNLYEPFKNKDARLLASVIVPGATFKSNTIIIQGGLINQSGDITAYAAGSAEGKDGKIYHTYGAPVLSSSGYSGFAGMTRSDDANFTSTGFTIRKFLAETKTVASTERSSSNSWIDMRLAEVYLNYAEAVVESGSGDPVLAAQCINALRKRAGHTDDIPLTLANVLKERRVELAFEGARVWDMFRRRDYHIYFNQGRRKALVPMIDLRLDEPKYIFVRANQYHDNMANGRTFNTINYYQSIPGIGDNRLIQNPGH